MYLAPSFFMPLHCLVLFTLLLPGTGRRSTRIGDSHDEAQQQTNMLTSTFEGSSDTREAFVPVAGFRHPGHDYRPRRSAHVNAMLGFGAPPQSPRPQTIGDARAAFQEEYGRPVNMLLQGFVNEMLTSVTLAQLKPGYQSSKVFSLGFEALCKTFLQGVNEEEKKRLHDALCVAVGFDPEAVKQDAAAIEAFANGKTEDDLLAGEDLKEIAAAGNFKYSYPLGAGLLTLMPMVGVEPSDEVIERWCTQLNLPASRLQKDWSLYVDATRRLVEARQMLADMGKRQEAKKGTGEA